MSEKYHQDGIDEESQPLTGEHHPPSVSSNASRTWLRIWTLVNALVTVSFILIATSSVVRSKPYTAPYSPLRRDGHEKLINTRYKPSKKYQVPLNSKEADDAWDGWILKYDKMFKVPMAEAKDTKLPHTVEMWKDRGYSAYSLGVYHQMHCLNRMRKSLFPDQYFVNETKEDVLDHTVHCFDVIRQSLLCHSDISIVYWWNRDWTYTDAQGTLRYSDKYLKMSAHEKQKDSFAVWDTTAQCRDFDAVHDWVLKHELDLTKYDDDTDSNQHHEAMKEHHHMI